MRVFNLLAVVVLCGACGKVAADTNGAEAGAVSAAGERAIAAPAAKIAKPDFREVTLPAGTTLRLTLQSAVASDSSRVEDPVRAELRQAVSVNGTPVLAAGTELVGSVTDVKRPGRVKGRALVAYRFNSLRAEGARYDIKTAPLSHQGTATKSEDATKIGIGAGAGAAIGAILGGGSGAAKGAAIGGGAGTGVVLATRGKDVHLGPGATVTTRLTAPLTVRIKA